MAINTIQAAEIKGTVSRCRGARLFIILAIKHDHVHQALSLQPSSCPSTISSESSSRAVVKKSVKQTRVPRFTIT
jgi:hypothetical protein